MPLKPPIRSQSFHNNCWHDSSRRQWRSEYVSHFADYAWVPGEIRCDKTHSIAATLEIFWWDQKGTGKGELLLIPHLQFLESIFWGKSKAGKMRGLLVSCALLLAATQVRAQADFETARNYEATKYAAVQTARGVMVDEAGDVLVVTKHNTASKITLLYEDNGVKTLTLVNTGPQKLNHGIAFNNGFLYASSDTTVYRWPYKPGQRTAITTAATVVIKNIPGGGHWSRTLAFAKDGLLYVSVGSNSNVDRDSSRARIRRFDISSFPNGGLEFNSGTVFADGLRNEVGLAFDADGVLWGVQNGADNLNRPDLGGDIHNTNPSEELTKYDQPLGTHYGYPYCWTVDQLANHPHGEQLAWPDFMNDGTHTDAWCKDPKNVSFFCFFNEPMSLTTGISFDNLQLCEPAEPPTHDANARTLCRPRDWILWREGVRHRPRSFPLLHEGRRFCDIPRIMEQAASSWLQGCPNPNWPADSPPHRRDLGCDFWAESSELQQMLPTCECRVWPQGPLDCEHGHDWRSVPSHLQTLIKHTHLYTQHVQCCCPKHHS